MGVLTKSLQKESAKTNKRDDYSAADLMHVPTGFDAIDYEGGTIVEDVDGDPMLNIGLPMGKIILCCGNSQAGKTTGALQFANGMASHLDGDVVIFDFERGILDPRSRIRNLCRLSNDEYDNRFTIYKNAGMSVEFFKKQIFKIVELKEKLAKADMVDWYMLNGAPVKIYPPTYVLLDSIPSMKPEDVLNDSSLDNNMVFSKMAAANSAMLTSIVNVLEKYNITLICINHITTKIIINAYGPRKVLLPGMEPEENLPGGNKFVYLPSYVLKFASGKALNKDKDFKVNGRVTNCTFLKSRSSFNGAKLPLAVTEKHGFSNVMTNILAMKEEKMLKGTGQGGFWFEGHEDMKFKQSEFIKKYNKDTEFQEMFDEVSSEFWQGRLEERFGEEYDSAEKSKSNDFDDDDDDE